MPITLQDIRTNAAEALRKLQLPSHPLFADDPRIAAANRADLRQTVRRVRSQYRDGQQIGELRHVARDWNTDVPTILMLCAGGRVH